MKNNNSIFKMTLTLVVIAVIVSVAMSYVNTITEPLIKQAEADKEKNALNKVLESAEIINPVDGYKTDNYTVYQGTDNEGNVVGYCVKYTISEGYGGDITVLTGLDIDLKVLKIEILSHSETAGLGANAAKDEFKDKFKNKTEGMTVVKNSPKENEIEAISGATITSKAVTKAVNESIILAKEVAGKC